MNESLWLIPFFFVAIGAGFFLGRRESKRRQRRRMASLSRDYVAGINFFLNEEPDKGIEALLKGLDVSEEGLDTHLALGKLFRKRGEFDRAAQLHTHLLEHGEFTRTQQEEIQLELAQDYLASGIFDLAEQVLLEMLDQDCQAKEEVTFQLMSLYEQERDWTSAINMGERLIKPRPNLAPIVAQYCCEQAESQLRDGDINPARRMVRRALNFDENCVRASVLEGQLEMREQHWPAAIEAYQRIWNQDSDFFDEVLDKLRECYQAEEREGDFIQMLADVSAEKPSTSRILLLSEALKQRYGDKEAADFISDYMKANPSVRGLNRIIDMSLAGTAEGETREHLGMLKQLSEQLLNDKTLYKCRRCGFETPLMQWRCPSCKRWSTIKPVPKEA
ncbi:tetratricopeptide repeat protein [Alcanivorax hongdengensis A-11-3]|uniref:Lipopolysaccharide assembly protein B n=1 Tax=Alcanivorax hongdengensis A-11-3 TaxID=1177179 RepID=L0WBM6_9GAMM|nr:lipopolysaccharide assembly protein LapB [Alcanivorax hongdengensis]EKF73487.1 tetratricopeptide repeat protein [Alcanivorax hongdengensis A-11-3]